MFLFDFNLIIEELNLSEEEIHSNADFQREYLAWNEEIIKHDKASDPCYGCNESRQTCDLCFYYRRLCREQEAMRKSIKAELQRERAKMKETERPRGEEQSRGKLIVFKRRGQLLN